MYSLPPTSFKRSFYSQTGNFQFSSTVQLNSNSNSLEFGISGSGQNNIKFTLNNGKVYDASGRFVNVYNGGDTVNISGNCGANSYDYSINGTQTAYGLAKSTGIYNYFYFKNGGVQGYYDFSLYGQQPSMAISNISCGPGDGHGYGTLTNYGLPVYIRSGILLNYPSGSLTGQGSFGFTGIPTGLLTSSETFSIATQPNTTGINSGTLRVFTNGGYFDYPLQVGITGTPINNFSLSLVGAQTVFNNNNAIYTSTISSSHNTPIIVSLSYSSGLVSGKSLTGVWGFTTGLGSSVVDFQQSGWFSTGKYTNTSGNIPLLSYGTIISTVSYHNSFNLVNDYAILTISGSGTNSGLSVNITGLA